MRERVRVLVIGAGPAGLAAATRLLESSGNGGSGFDVELMHMGHHLGGKAASYPDPANGGRTTKEHGWHMLLGFYTRMRALMERAGVDWNTALVSMGGKSHAYESFSERVHTLNSAQSRVQFASDFLMYDGLPPGDRLNFSRFMGQTFLTAASAASGGDLTRHDDICFRTWAIEHGLRPHITDYSLFRFFQEAYFNYPESISAYHVLRSMSLMTSGEDAEMFVPRGGMSETIWQPIARYFQKLGGVITPYSKATDWVWEGRRIVGVRVARPDESQHHPESGRAWPDDEVPVEAATAKVYRDFDHVISTVPVAVLQGMNRAHEGMWSSPYFSRLKNLRSAATLSLTVLLREPYMESFAGPVFGLPAPLGIVTNMKRYWPAYTNDDAIGAALHFVGQEAGFEQWTDEQIIAFTLDNLSGVAQLGDVRAAGIEHVEFHRNRADHARLMLCEPGVQQFRPGPRTPFENLFVAGDWVRNEVDLVCMEGAIASGTEAADMLLAQRGDTG